MDLQLILEDVVSYMLQVKIDMLKISDELINEFSVVGRLHQPMALSK
jgi:nicotinamide mononucleotide (NMN) deamidase PncC